MSNGLTTPFNIVSQHNSASSPIQKQVPTFSEQRMCEIKKKCRYRSLAKWPRSSASTQQVNRLRKGEPRIRFVLPVTTRFSYIRPVAIKLSSYGFIDSGIQFEKMAVNELVSKSMNLKVRLQSSTVRE